MTEQTEIVSRQHQIFAPKAALPRAVHVYFPFSFVYEFLWIDAQLKDLKFSILQVFYLYMP